MVSTDLSFRIEGRGMTGFDKITVDSKVINFGSKAISEISKLVRLINASELV